MNKITSRLIPDLDPYREILDMESSYSVVSDDITKEEPFDLEEKGSNLDLLDSLTCNKEEMLKLNTERYWGSLGIELRSTPQDLLCIYGLCKPSEITRINFRELNQHDLIFTGGGSSVTITNVRKWGSLLLDRVKKFNRENPDITTLNEEWQTYLRFADNLWMTANYYLHSLDIPDQIKQLYPAEKNYRSLEERMRDITFRWGMAAAYGSPTERMVHIPLVTLYGLLGITFIPINLMYCLGSSYVGRSLNKRRRDTPNWVPFSEEHVRSDPFEKCPFWLYFVYHPEKDVPPDLNDNTFNPTPLINSSFYPRSLLKESVFRLYETMDRTLDYYRSHAVPFNDSWIYQARTEVLKSIKEIDSFTIRERRT